MSNTIEIPAGTVPVIIAALCSVADGARLEVASLRDTIGMMEQNSIEDAARIDELEAMNATLSAKLMDGPEEVIAQMQVEPPAPWKTPLPEGHEQWVQRMCEAPEEFVRRMGGSGWIDHRSDPDSYIAAVYEKSIFVHNNPRGSGCCVYDWTPALRAAIDKMEVVG